MRGFTSKSAREIPMDLRGNRGTTVAFSPMRAVAGSRTALDTGGGQRHRDDRLSVILCERGSVVAMPPGVTSMACPILGGASVLAREWSVQLGKADIWVGDAQARHDIVVSVRGGCLVVAGTQAAWSLLDHGGGGRAGALLFPAIHRFVPAFARRLLRIVRQCLCDVNGADAAHIARQLANLVDDIQATFAPMIGRCPGSGLMRKKAVFLRLQRVRNYISACAHHDLDVAKLALIANYSLGHFITTFRSVFEETPYSTVNRSRLESASTLLSGSNLGIADIAQAIGFQSRSSFTRAIKKHLGSSASQFRERRAAVASTADEAPGPDSRFVAALLQPVWQSEFEKANKSE